MVSGNPLGLIEAAQIGSGLFLRWRGAVAMAQATQIPTWGQWLRSGFRPIYDASGLLTRASTLVEVTASSTLNAVIITIAFEAGVFIGSMISAGWQGYSYPCP